MDELVIAVSNASMKVCVMHVVQYELPMLKYTSSLKDVIYQLTMWMMKWMNDFVTCSKDDQWQTKNSTKSQYWKTKE